MSASFWRWIYYEHKRWCTYTHTHTHTYTYTYTQVWMNGNALAVSAFSHACLPVSVWWQTVVHLRHQCSCSAWEKPPLWEMLLTENGGISRKTMLLTENGGISKIQLSIPSKRTTGCVCVGYWCCPSTSPSSDEPLLVCKQRLDLCSCLSWKWVYNPQPLYTHTPTVSVPLFYALYIMRIPTCTCVYIIITWSSCRATLSVHFKHNNKFVLEQVKIHVCQLYF